MSQTYAVGNEKLSFILTKQYKVSTKCAHKQKCCFVLQAQFSPWNSQPNPMEMNTHLETNIKHKHVYIMG